MLSTLFEVQSFCAPLVLYFLSAPTFSHLVALGHRHSSAVSQFPFDHATTITVQQLPCDRSRRRT